MFEKSLKVNFGKFSKDESRSLISNKTKLSLLLAKKYLEKIPVKMNSTSKKNNRLEFEIMSEGFLFFIIGARDALLQQINTKFSLSLQTDEIELSRILGSLDRAISEQNQVRILLNDATQVPTHSINGWERNKTWLWELNHLRNRIAHQSIISGSIHVMVGSTEQPQTSMIIYTRNGQFQNDPIKEPKPKDYFNVCVKKFEKLVSDIEALFPT